MLAMPVFLQPEFTSSVAALHHSDGFCAYSARSVKHAPRRTISSTGSLSRIDF
jgi:hypothetical protein